MVEAGKLIFVTAGPEMTDIEIAPLLNYVMGRSFITIGWKYSFQLAQDLRKHLHLFLHEIPLELAHFLLK